MKRFLNILLVVAAVTGCAKEKEVWSPKETGFVTVTDMGLEVGDIMSVLDGADNVLYTVQSVGNPSVFVNQAGLAETATDVFAVFPYDETATRAENSVTLTVPSVQKGVKDGIDKSAAVFATYTSNLVAQTELQFQPMTSYLRLNFPKEENIVSVEFRSVTGEPIAGSIKASFVEKDDPYIVVVDGTDKVTLTSEDGFDGQNTVAFLPAVLENGLELKMTNNYGETVTKKMVCRDANGVESAMTLTRGKINRYDISFDSVELEWYSSLVASIEKSLYSNVIVSWTCDKEPSKYLIIVDGQEVGSVDAPADSFTITSLEKGFSGEVSVVAVYPDGSQLKSKPVRLHTVALEVKVDKAFWSDAHISWDAVDDCEKYIIMIDGETIGEAAGDVSTYHITGLTNGFSGMLSVASVENGVASSSEEVELKTGSIWQLNRNPGPTSVSVGFDNMAGELTESTPLFKVELYDTKDITEGAEPLYSAYVIDDQQFADNPFVDSKILAHNSTMATVPTHLAFGSLEPAKSYWFRIKSESGNDFPLTSPLGDSEFSQLFELKTEASHTPAEKEVLFQGFDGVTLLSDMLNSAPGIIPAYAEEGKTAKDLNGEAIKEWTGNWRFSVLRTIIGSSQIANMSGFSSVGSMTAPFSVSSKVMSPSYCSDAKLYTFTSAWTGMEGWYFSNGMWPGQGYLQLGSYYGSTESKDQRFGFIATPALNSEKLGNESVPCVVAFRALAIQGRAATMHIGRYDGSRWEAEPAAIQIHNSAGTTEQATSWSSSAETHKWYDYFVEMDLKNGDIVVFATDNKTKNATVLIDDICIMLK